MSRIKRLLDDMMADWEDGLTVGEIMEKYQVSSYVVEDMIHIYEEGLE